VGSPSSISVADPGRLGDDEDAADPGRAGGEVIDPVRIGADDADLGRAGGEAADSEHTGAEAADPGRAGGDGDLCEERRTGDVGEGEVWRGDGEPPSCFSLSAVETLGRGEGVLEGDLAGAGEISATDG